MKRRAFSPLVASGFAVALAAACGSSEESSEGTDGPSGAGQVAVSGEALPLDALGDAYREIVCRTLIECSGEPYRDLEHCMAARETPGLADVIAGVEEGKIDYDPDRVGLCRDFYLDNLCDAPFLFTPTVPEALGLCFVTEGTLGEGEACRSTLECASGFCDTESACPGVCRALPQEGDPCENEGDVCALDLGGLTIVDLVNGLLPPSLLTCRQGQCVQGEGPGADCASNTDCVGPWVWCNAGSCELVEVGDPCGDEADGLECFSLNAFCDDAGICRQLGRQGDACSTESECIEELRCIVGEGESGMCSAPSSAGDPCDSNRDCEPRLGCAEGACVALPVLGEPCLAGDCDEGFICEEAACQTAGYPGDACGQAGVVCAESRCQDGECRLGAQFGEACETADDCLSGDCVGGECIDDDLCENQAP